MPTKNPYSFSVEPLKRSEGKSAVASAAYQAGEKLRDERTGRRCDWSRKKGVTHAEILAPARAPGWARNRGALWNTVETTEKRVDAQLARKFILALPRQLAHEQRLKYTREFIQEQFVDRGMIADFALHDPEPQKNQDNYHAHVMLTMRDVDPEGFGKKNRDWNQIALLEKWREQWAAHTNRALVAQGFEPTWDHRTLEEQGIDRFPQIHLGQAVLEMETRGIKTDLGERALEISRANALLEELEEIEKEINDHQDERTRTDSKVAQPAAADRKTRAAAPASQPANFHPAKPGGEHGQSPKKTPATTPTTKVKPTRPASQSAMNKPQEGEPDMNNLSPAEQQEFLRVRRQIAAHQQSETEARQRHLTEEQKRRFIELEELAEEAERTRADHRYLDNDFAWGCLHEMRQRRQTVETADWQGAESKVAAQLLQNGANLEDVASLIFDFGLSATTGNPVPTNALEHLQNLALNSPDLADAMKTAERREKEEKQQRLSDEDGDHDHHKQSFPKLGM